MAGFWETLSQSVPGAFDNYNKLKEEKRRRAMQKLQFITENSDVGTEVDPRAAQEINDYASEGSGLIQDGKYVGNPDQQRAAEFRQYIEQNPQADPETIMTRGAAQGVVPAGTYGSFLSGQESRAQRMQELQMRLTEQRANQEDRQQFAMAMKSIPQAIASRGGGGDFNPDGSDFYGSKANVQKLVANRRAYGNDPYSHLINRVFGDPKTAAMTLGSEGEEADINRPEPWENYLNTLASDPEIRRGLMTEYGLRNQEMSALEQHMQAIAAKKRALVQKGK